MKIKLSPPQQRVVRDMVKGAKIKHYINDQGNLCFDTDADGHTTLYLTLSMRALHGKGLIVLRDNGLCDLVESLHDKVQLSFLGY